MWNTKESEVKMTKPLVNKDAARVIENQIRGYIAASGLTMSSLAALIVEKLERPESAQSFSQKLKRGTIKYAEVLQIADLLGYKIIWDKAAK